MDKPRELTPNVLQFLDQTALIYGRMMAERFSQEMYCNCREVGPESPIEDLFWIACSALLESDFQSMNPDPIDSSTLQRGIYIRPQWLIGNYRVDFFLHQIGVAPEEIYTPLVVELDGHDFHDKDKRQRSYEKARDRFLVKSGYRVFHFTGSDVVSNPFKVAHEVLCAVGAFVGTDQEKFDPSNPLGIE